jgi:hypothetical protein
VLKEKNMMAHRTSGWVLTLCCVVTVTFQAQAQTPATRDNPSNREPYRTKSPSNDRESTTVEQTQREIAISIINSLVDQAERYRDQTLRVRTQARAADALWSIDQVQARELFLRAWKTAERVDEEADQTAEVARKRALSTRGGGITMIPPAASLRSEVLRLAARRDPSLGEFLLAKLEKEKEREDGTSDQKSASSEGFDPTEPSIAITKRLEVALQLLNAGDLKQAKAFAGSALGFTTSQGIIFLCALRQKDSDAADELYARLLARAATDPSAEATTVSLLSSYAFTPTLLVTATIRGRISNQFGDTTQSYELSPGLRTNFFRVAAAILLRPPSYQDRTVAGRAGTYFTIARLLPLFERYAPNYIPALNAQLAMLAPDAPETFRNGQENMLRLGLGPEGPNRDTVPEILNQLGGAASSAERDTLYVKAIRAGAPNGDPRIREFADKIEDENLRERARSFADLALVRSAISKKDVEGGLRIVRGGYLSTLHRVWALSQIASLVKSDPARVSQLLDDAATEANHIDGGEADRVYALACVSASFFTVDRFRSWGVASDAISAANAVPGFTGEDGKLSARLRTKNVISMISVNEPSFNIVNLFDLLSRDDLELAISLANDLKEESPRAAATLAIASSILKRQKTPAFASRR